MIEQYIPGEYANIRIAEQLFYQLKDQGYEIKFINQITLLKSLTDSLSNDHIIGSSYHNYDAVTFILDSLQNEYPNISKLISIGQTVEGREMWAICITDNPKIEEVEPEIKYVANMHGDELITQEIMLIFTEYLLENYDSDGRVQQLINNNELWIMPNMNFDGSQILQRRNINNIDLNRNFPDRDTAKEPDSLQAETINMINWSQNHNFVLSANFHSGALVINYPWDYNFDGSSDYAATPDDETFIRLALAYAKENLDIYNSEYFSKGIINGAQWYQVTNGMMDWNYHYLSCMDLTIELSEQKMPHADSLLYYWDMNRESMLNLIEQVNSGVHGIITDSLTNEAISAEVKVSEIGKSVHTDPDLGDYYRLLEPGTYQFLFDVDGYYPELVNDVVVDSGMTTNLNVMLKPVIYYTLSGHLSDSLSNENFYQNSLLKDSIITNTTGDYLKKLPVGKYYIVSKFQNYFDQEFQIDLFEDKTLDFKLVKIIPGYITGSLNVMDSGNWSESIVFCQMKSDTLRGDNFFQIDTLIPGNIKIFVSKFDYKTTFIDTFLENGSSLNLDGIQLLPGVNDYFTDFESGNSNFNSSGDWQINSISSGPNGAYSGSFAWATNPAGNYSSGLRIHSLETNIFSLQNMAIPALEIYHWFDIENGYDGANIKISDEYGQNWKLLHPNPDYPVESLTDEFNNPLAGEPVYSGNSGGWDKITFNLSQFKNWPFVKFRFDLGVDEQKSASGWYLDDFRIFDANATEIVDNPLFPEDETLDVKIYPNPANPATTFFVTTNFTSEVDIIIYNINGQAIKKILIRASANQPTKWQWQGKNSINNLVASGIYFARIESLHHSIVKKIILIR
ncbi:MAG: M14 family zinc carboxypeptidase [Calditrichaceae bacterium]